MIDEILKISDQIRYAAIYEAGELKLGQRSGLSGASESESDRYEELLVNPTLLKLASQRGDIDCGGLEFLLLRYGNFFQFVQPTAAGHVSVAIECDADPLLIASQIRAYMRSQE